MNAVRALNVAPPTEATAPTPAPAAVAGFEDLPALMSPRMLAEVLDVSTKTLERWRAANGGKGNGLPWRTLPGSSLIRYTRRDVVAWIESCSQGEEGTT